MLKLICGHTLKHRIWDDDIRRGLYVGRQNERKLLILVFPCALKTTKAPVKKEKYWFFGA